MSNRAVINQEMEKQLKDFYKRRAKNPDDFGYTADGNVISKSGEIAMNTYRPPTISEIEEVEKIRREAIAVAEAAYEDARRDLYTVVGDGLNPDSVEILIANKKVADADLALQYARYGERGMSATYTFPRNKILFEEKYDERIIGAIELPILRGLTLMDQYVRIGEAAVAVATDGSKAPAAAPAVSVLVFSDPESDLGYLSWAYATEIVIGDTTYTSPYQAVMGELAKYYGDTIGLDELLNAESPDEIEYGPDDVGTTEEDWDREFEEQLGKVMRMKFEQHPVLVEQLLQTGDALLGAAIDGDTLYGIGLPASSAFVKKPNKWTGQNRLGKLLMAIRQEQKIVREQAPVEQPKKRRIKRASAAIAAASAQPEAALAAPEQPAAVGEVVQPVVEAAVAAPEAVAEVVQPVAEAALAAPAQPAAPEVQPKKKRVLRLATAPIQPTEN